MNHTICKACGEHFIDCRCYFEEKRCHCCVCGTTVIYDVEIDLLGAGIVEPVCFKCSCLRDIDNVNQEAGSKTQMHEGDF